VSFTYLASPYTHHDPVVREQRFLEATRAAARLMLREPIFSPISHSHPIDAHFHQPASGEFWKAQDVPILRHAARLKVLMLPNWEASSGIAWEIEMARQLRIPIEYIEP